MEITDPKFVPKLARKLAKWMRTTGPENWATKAVGGTKFVNPPSLPPITHNVAGYRWDPFTEINIALPDRTTVEHYSALAAYYAETLEQGKSFWFSKELTNLAIRTSMPKYKLTLDMLPKGAPWGFIMWDMPIGDAERGGAHKIMRHILTGEYEEVPENRFNYFEDAEIPVVAASWRYEPEADSVWVAFYTKPTAIFARFLKDDRIPKENLERAKTFFEPLTLEREQELPLGRILDWFHADSAEGKKLELTAAVDPANHPEHLRHVARERIAAVQPGVSSMVKTLLATWMIMQWQIATREEIPPPQDIVRKLKKTGMSRGEITRKAGTTVYNLGAPIRRRATAAQNKGYTWKVRALVGPVVRTSQYIPAWGAYDDEPRFIEPFWAGPPDAPISNADKVFAFDEDLNPAKKKDD